MTVWCPICGVYHDGTSSSCCWGTSNLPKPSMPKLICPHCGKEIEIEVKK